MIQFGRTNQLVSQTWIRPELGDDPEALMAEVVATGAVIDISSSPLIWGNSIRGGDHVLFARGSLDYERAISRESAIDLVCAHLIQTLSTIGRESIDFFALPFRRAVEDEQLEGALEALELAKGDGLIKHGGLMSEGPELATLSMWRFHDAFEFIVLGERSSELEALARERRVGVAVRNTSYDEGVVIKTVSRVEDIGD